jgi:hypothetical protein
VSWPIARVAVFMRLSQPAIIVEVRHLAVRAAACANTGCSVFHDRCMTKGSGVRTEDEIEQMVKRLTDAVDAAYLAHRMTEAQYRARLTSIDDWANRERRWLPKER